jgi:hypothetical protein
LFEPNNVESRVATTPEAKEATPGEPKRTTTTESKKATTTEPKKATTTESSMATTSDSSAAASPVVIYIGKRKRSQVRKLTKGRGPLLGVVSDTIADLEQSGVVQAGAQPVILVVRDKGRKKKKGKRGLADLIWPGLP